MRVTIDFSDGQYSMTECNNPNHPESTIISEATWRAYLAHCDQSHAWWDFIRTLNNNLEE